MRYPIATAYSVPSPPFSFSLSLPPSVKTNHALVKLTFVSLAPSTLPSSYGFAGRRRIRPARRRGQASEHERPEYILEYCVCQKQGFFFFSFFFLPFFYYRHVQDKKKHERTLSRLVTAGSGAGKKKKKKKPCFWHTGVSGRVSGGAGTKN